MKKVIIIGAGPAGLTAAYELLKDNNEEYEVIILEENTQVGGISKTVKYNGNRMDIGGHRFFSKDENVMKFWSELMPIQGEPSIDDKILGREKTLEKADQIQRKQTKLCLLEIEFLESTILKSFLIIQFR